jgi:cytidine deaminase
MDHDRLLAEARAAALKAYAPYSAFRVGAALVVLDDHQIERVVSGCNVENASYGLSLCAERNALSTAIALYGAALAGKPRITQIAIVCDWDKVPADAPLALRSPCGACRQWIAELAPEAGIILDGQPESFSIDDLLPNAFRL